MDELKDPKFIVIGGGPAGLTAAYELTKNNIKPLVFEQGDKVGGIARTENYKGYYFDMGGHRFFTKIPAAQKMWKEVLGDEFLLRPRLSRIYYNGKFFAYPLKPMNALLNLGLWQAFLTGVSYLRWQIAPYKEEETFEQWVTNRFGRRLFLTFFKAYTEKVWGVSTSVLKAEFAAQRIKDLSLKSALVSMFIKPGQKITTLIEEFHYPRRGPGMLWERTREIIEERGGRVCLNTEVMKFQREGNRVTRALVRENGSEYWIDGTHFISSMPVSEFIKRLDPVPADVLAAANQLNYRDFLTVCLIIKQPTLFPDNWIYIHSPEVKVGRIQNFKNWSADMVPDPNTTSLGMEYFCTVGDEIWNMTDQDLIELGRQEIDRIGLAQAEDVVDGVVFRVPKAYPIYDEEYGLYLDSVKGFINGLENFQTVGRNGLHRYNNQDHSMLTAMKAVRNALYNEKNDLWSVNTEREYSEELVQKIQRTLQRVFLRVDPISFGLATGITAGIILMFATLFLVVKGGPVIGPNLSLLAQFFPGYTVTPAGSLLGFLYMFLAFFVIGSAGAHIRNLIVLLNAILIHKDIELEELSSLLDYFR